MFRLPARVELSFGPSYSIDHRDGTPLRASFAWPTCKAPCHYHLSPLSIDPAVARMATLAISPLVPSSSRVSLRPCRSSRNLHYSSSPTCLVNNNALVYSIMNGSLLTAQLQPTVLGTARRPLGLFSTVSSVTVRLLRHANVPS